MKFNIAPPVAASANLEARVGDVFPAKGGARYKIAMWVVIAITESGGTVLLGLNERGEVTSATTYASHVMERRHLIGRVEGLDELEFNIEVLP